MKKLLKTFENPKKNYLKYLSALIDQEDEVFESGDRVKTAKSVHFHNQLKQSKKRRKNWAYKLLIILSAL